MGYIGFSRSERSHAAIQDFEVPLSHVNKELIDMFLSEIEDDYTADEMAHLRKARVYHWKEALEFNGPSSWHHTSNHFNRTDHYNMYDVVQDLLESDLAPRERVAKEDRIFNYSYGYVKVEVWGGTRNYPKMIGHEEYIGIIVGDWIHTTQGNKCKLSARKTVDVKSFESYKDLVKSYPQFKNNKPKLNAVIKRLEGAK